MSNEQDFKFSQNAAKNAEITDFEGSLKSNQLPWVNNNQNDGVVK